MFDIIEIIKSEYLKNINHIKLYIIPTIKIFLFFFQCFSNIFINNIVIISYK